MSDFFYKIKMKILYPCIMKCKLCCIDDESKQYVKKAYKNKSIKYIKDSPIAQKIIPLMLTYDKDFDDFKL